MRHPRAEGLDVPLLGSMKTELTVKAVGVDLRGNLQKDHTGKAAAMGVGGVVITSLLTVQPEIDGLQVIAARDPWATALGRLAIHHAESSGGRPAADAHPSTTEHPVDSDEVPSVG